MSGYYQGWDGRERLSTGVHAVILAMLRCEHVDVYNFGECASESKCGKYCRYYDDDVGCAKGYQAHNFEAEHQYLVHLHECGLVTLID